MHARLNFSTDSNVQCGPNHSEILSIVPRSKCSTVQWGSPKAITTSSIAEKDQILAQDKQILAEKDQIIAERSPRVLKTDAFVFVDRTASNPHCASGTPDKSKLQTKNVTLDAFPDKVWHAPYIRLSERKEVSVDSESMVLMMSAEIVEALIDGLGLGKQVHVSKRRTVTGVEYTSKVRTTQNAQTERQTVSPMIQIQTNEQ
jgi:hypothetical protein